MTAINLTTLQSIQDLSLEDFKAAHAVGNNVAVTYYNELASQGTSTGNSNITNYAALAKDVAGNSGITGVYANAYSKAVADDHSVNFTVGSDDWLKMQFELMRADYATRADNVANSGTGELDYGETNANHAAAFDAVGLPPESYSLYTPLETTGEGDPAKAQEMFLQALPGEGMLDLALDALDLGFGAEISSKQHLADILRDYGAQAEWLGYAFDAASDVVNTYGGDPGQVEDLLDGLESLADLAAGGFNQLADWADAIGDLADNYSGGFNIPTSLLGRLPLWIGGALAPWGSAPSQASPLILDLDGDGIELTTFNASTTDTFFDLDSDGFAEQTAWVGADDGLLVRDLNANGRIDDAGELFGSPSIDGFALLAQLDTNGDLIIDANDDDWDDLRIWKDANGDAITDEGELLTLASLDIVSIDLAGVSPSTSTISGNPISHTSTFKYANGSTDSIVDAWFVHDQVNTQATQSYTLDLRALYLPTLRGFGQLADLHVAMSADGDLLTLVEDFVDEWGFDRFADEASLDSDFEDILFAWAGVDGVNPTSRGNYMDAQKLVFMEKFFGEGFVLHTGNPNPGLVATSILNEAWNLLFSSLKSHMLVQLGAGSLFDAVNYDAFAGEVVGDTDISEAGVDALVSYATDTGVNTEAYWIAVARFIQPIKDFGDFTSPENGWIDDAVYDSDPTLTWEDIKYSVTGIFNGDTLYGDSGDNTLNGGGGYDELWGYGGNDTLNGGDGDDELYGGDGDDTLNGGLDDDYLSGGAGADILNPGGGNDFAYGAGGDDIYYFTGGDDFYEDDSYGGSDEIRLASGLDSSDLSFHGRGSGNLFITVDGVGTIEISKQFNDAYHSRAIETLRFYDNSTLDLIDLDEIDIHGTSGDDSIEWLHLSSSTDASFFGYAGDDSIYGGASADTIDGGIGNDYLVGGDGNDAYIASPGFDRIADGYANSGDSIHIPLGYGPDDLTFFRNVGNENALQILIAGLGQIEVQMQYWGTQYLGVETITFESGATAIDLTNASIETRGGDGNDYVYGLYAPLASEDDILYGGAGNDELIGYAGDDTYVFSEGIDRIQETSGTDEILFRDDTDINDLTFYRGYSTTYQYNDLYVEHVNGSIMHVYQHFANSDYEVEGLRFADSSTFDFSTLSGLDVVGRDGLADVITISSSSGQTVYGLGGSDTITGGTGDDVLDGGAGNDTLNGGAGNDTFIFGAGYDLDTAQDLYGGNDTVHITGATTINDIGMANYSSYHAQLTVTASVDVLTVNYLRHGNANYQIENLSFDDGFVTDQFTDYQSWMWGSTGATLMSGNANDNVLIGKAGDDEMYGGAGDDDMHGGADNDEMYGEDGDDLLHGGTGDDILYGGDGLDILWGGEGADTFVFENASAFNDVDIVKDFSISDDDVIHLVDIMDNTAFDPMTDAITDWIEFTTVGSDTVVKVDRDGTGGTYGFDQIATLEGVTGLTDEAALVTSGHLLLAA